MVTELIKLADVGHRSLAAGDLHGVKLLIGV